MEDPEGIWAGMAGFLRNLPASLPERPRAILIVSGHWETRGFALTGSARPPLVFDYYGFPPHTYQLRYDAPGAPTLAGRAAQLLQQAGFSAAIDPQRGLDHGVFVPLKVVFPEADIPVVELSLDAGLDPALHLAAGRALAPLRDEGVLIMGSGLSYHNLRALRMAATAGPVSDQFEAWLTQAVSAPDAAARAQQLSQWDTAPAARLAHPREEHLIPLMVAAGAAGESRGALDFRERVWGVSMASYRFSDAAAR